MSERYRTSATIDSVSPVAGVPDGLSVTTANPLQGHTDPAHTNPEQLLALAWATCLNATAQAVVSPRTRTRVRVEVALADAEGRPGFEFHVTAFVSGEGLSVAQAQELAEAAHQRCPISRLLVGARTVAVQGEAFAA